MKKIIILISLIFLITGIESFSQNIKTGQIYTSKCTGVRDSTFVLVNDRSFAGYLYFVEFDWSGFTVTNTYLYPQEGLYNLGPIGLVRAGSPTDTMQLNTTSGHKSLSGKITASGKLIIPFYHTTNAGGPLYISWSISKP